MAIDLESTTAPPELSDRARRERIDRPLAAAVDFGEGCPPRLAEAIRYALLSPGKRLRPILTLLAAEVARAWMCRGGVVQSLAVSAASCTFPLPRVLRGRRRMVHSQPCYKPSARQRVPQSRCRTRPNCALVLGQFSWPPPTSWGCG